jgi:hypothetical protein
MSCLSTVLEAESKLCHGEASKETIGLKYRYLYNQLIDDVQYPGASKKPICVFRGPFDVTPRISAVETEVLTLFGFYTILKQLFFEQIRMHILRQPFTDFR